MLKYLSPATELTDTENKVVAFFIQEKEILKNVPEPHKSKLLFSEDSRKRCREFLEIKVSQFNVIFSSLKKKGIVNSKDGIYKFPKLIDAIGEETISLKYEFNI